MEGARTLIEFPPTLPSAWAPFSPVCGSKEGRCRPLRTDGGGPSVLFSLSLTHLTLSLPRQMARMNKHRRPLCGAVQGQGEL